LIILQFATALAIGAYVVLSKDAQPRRADTTAREAFQLQYPADHFLERDSRSPAHSQTADCLIPLQCCRSDSLRCTVDQADASGDLTMRFLEQP